MASPKKPYPTSADLNSIAVELRYAGDRAEIVKTCVDIETHLRTLDFPEHYWDFIELGRGQKKNFAQRFSNALAQKVANALRPKFPGILPDEHGRGQESRSSAAGGLKKLDVNYSTTSMGLGLAVSLKTINFRDGMSERYTKNIKRIDGEMRAEAQDCHTRQPFAVLVGIILLPTEACDDGVDESSLFHAWSVFSRRGGRESTEDERALFERIYIGLYESTGASAGSVDFFDVNKAEAPKRGLPPSLLTFTDLLEQTKTAFVSRNPHKR